MMLIGFAGLGYAGYRRLQKGGASRDSRPDSAFTLDAAPALRASSGIGRLVLDLGDRTLPMAPLGFCRQNALSLMKASPKTAGKTTAELRFPSAK
jgi:hypothetical protein